MLAFIMRRLLAMIPTLFLVSILTFIIIELPPGDFMTNLAANVGTSGSSMDAATVENLRRQYGLDKPATVRYLTWIAGFVARRFWLLARLEAPGERPDRGPPGADPAAFAHFPGHHVDDRHADRHLFGHPPVLLGDNVLTLLGFLGLSVPDFLLGLVYLFVGIFVFSISVTGLVFQRNGRGPLVARQSCWTWSTT